MVGFDAPLICALFLFSVQVVHLQYEDYEYSEEEYEEPKPVNCSTAETIRGGLVTYSQGGLESSVLTYHCPRGYYAFPISQRLCGAHGEWSIMILANSRRFSQATCKEVLCPAQLELNNGEMQPRNQWFRPGMFQSFSCLDGFSLSGSANRTCTLSGEWTGTTPTCDNYADDCKDPGVPPGARRSVGRFEVGETAQYRCQAGLDLLGSAKRVCLESRVWSGSTPRCQATHSFDNPSMVAAAMAESLTGVMDVLSPEQNKEGSFARTISLTDDSRVNVYILLDTSGSISKEDFKKSREAAISLIRKLDSYDVQMKFHVTSFAGEAKDIVTITDTFFSEDADMVIRSVQLFDYKSHGHKTGTNLYAALQRVNEMISIYKQNRMENHFNETQNVVIIQTDGFSNTGTSPQAALALMRHLLGYSSTSLDHNEEMLLDIYVFGVGENINKAELNSIASQKHGEKHLFILRDYETLGGVFNSMISDKSVTKCGLAQEVSMNRGVNPGTEKVENRPWHVTLTMIGGKSETKCYGSIVSQNWILTAAHCFGRSSTAEETVEVEHGLGMAIAEEVIMHPKYNLDKLRSRNVSEFYDYDVALVRLNESIPLSLKTRPICLPCTVAAGRAMKRINSNCEEQRRELLQHKETLAFFIHKDSQRKETYIQTDDQRQKCVEEAKRTLKKPTNVTMDEYVPERFLCSGGSGRFRHSITCKGDSGGSLFLQNRMRYFQVGVVSWGTVDVCGSVEAAQQGLSADQPPPEARDFHISLFAIVPWLKHYLGREIEFLASEN